MVTALKSASEDIVHVFRLLFTNVPQSAPIHYVRVGTVVKATTDGALVIAAPAGRTAMRNVAAVAVRFAIEIDEITACVDAGTVYSVVRVVALGFD